VKKRMDAARQIVSACTKARVNPLHIGSRREAQRHHEFRITGNDLTYPPKLDIEDIEPRQVSLNIDARAAENPRPAP